MAFSRDKNTFLLKEGVLKLGTVTNPEQIGTNANTPESHFSVLPIGYVKQGTINVGLNRTYAEFLAGTPGETVRKDLILKKFSITLESGQFDKDSIEVFKGARTQPGVVFTSPATETHNLHHLGPDEPIQTDWALLLDTFLTDGRRFLIGMYAGRNTTEDISMALAGTDYTINNAIFEAFGHDNFLDTTNEFTSKYGFIDEIIA